MAWYDAAASGLLGYFAGDKANNAQQKAAQTNADTLTANRNAITNLNLNQNSPFKSITPNAAGGPDVSYGEAGPIAADNRLLAVMGDRNRQAGRNNITDNFKYNFPTYGAADNALQGQRNDERVLFDSGLDKIATAAQRASGGVQNSGTNRNAIDAIGDYTAQAGLRFGPEATQKFLNTSQQGDLSTAQQALAFLNPQGPQSPGFDETNNSGGLTAALSQAPLPTATANYGSSLPFAAGANAISNYQTQAAQTANNARTDELYKALIDRLRKG